MNEFSTTTAWQAAGWTAIHFLWLGTALAAAAACGRRLLRRSSPHARYVFTLACFCGLAVTPLGIYVGLTRQGSHDAASGAYSHLSAKQATLAAPSAEGVTRALRADAPSALSPVTASPPRGKWFARLDGLSRWLPWFWLCGSFVTALGWMAGLASTEGLRRRCRPLDDGEIVAACRAAARTLGVARRVAVAITDRVASPAVLGIVRPMVLLPSAILVGVDPRQLEMILLHELAHVRRWDNLVNLGQRIVESLLFYHPAVWWLSGRLRLDRELCCDCIVIAHTGERRQYAEVLAALVVSDTSLPSCAAAMADRHITLRIRHILNLEEPAMSLSHKALTVGAAVSLAAGLFVAAWADQPEATPPADSSAAAAAPDETPAPRNIDLDKVVADGAAYLGALVEAQAGGDPPSNTPIPPARVHIVTGADGATMALRADGLEMVVPPNADYETLQRMMLDLSGVALYADATQASQQCQNCHRAPHAELTQPAAEQSLQLRIDDELVRRWRLLQEAKQEKMDTLAGGCPAAQQLQYTDMLSNYYDLRKVLVDGSVSLSRPWGPEQATGAPDTPEAGDYSTAWASLSQDDGPEWLELTYEQPIEVAAALIHESFNPGAVCRVVAFVGDAETVVWEGTAGDRQRRVSVVPFAGNPTTQRIRIELDSSSVAGWNEIDAVGLIDSSGNTHWASGATASSTYADRADGGDGASSGIDFLTAADPAAAERIGRLEAEVQALRAALEQLRAELQRREGNAPAPMQ